MAETIIHRYDDRQRVAEFAFIMEIDNKIYPMVQHNNEWYVDSSIINIVTGMQKTHTVIAEKTYYRMLDVLVASIPDNFEKTLNAYVDFVLAIKISENNDVYARMKKELFDVG